MSDSHTRCGGDDHHAGHVKQVLHALLRHLEATEKLKDMASPLLSRLEYLLVQSRVHTLIVDDAEFLCPEHAAILHRLAQQMQCQVPLRGGDTPDHAFGGK